MTLQEIFDQVWNHFVVKRNRASVRTINSETQCAYRGVAGARCAIGLVIPDELYHTKFEGKSITAIVQIYDKLANIFEGLSAKSLEDLQRCHDQAYKERGRAKGYTFHDLIKAKLESYANDYNLTIPA